MVYFFLWGTAGLCPSSLSGDDRPIRGKRGFSRGVEDGFVVVLLSARDACAGVYLCGALGLGGNFCFFDVSIE